MFDFKRHCLYCGNACELNKDPNNPQRWRPAFLCHSTLTEHGDRPYKEYLLDKCHSRNDHWANEVQTRIKAAVSDLHAVDARYHKDCMSIFVRNRCLADNLKDTSQTDEALQDVIEILQADRSRIWNSIELFKEYQDNHGCALTRCRLVEELRRNIGGDLVVLTNPGYASVIAFHKNAALMLKLVKADDESDDIGRSVSILANHVVKECKSIACDKSVYQMHVDMDIAAECASSTLLNLLANLSTKLDMLTVTRNKVQLIDLICEDMAFHKDDFSQHKLVLTGSDSVPVEINRGVIIKRQYMKTTQEEADTMVVQQVAEVKAKKVLVVADDTDICVLLLHFCCLGDIPASTSVLMVSPIRGRAVIDINATVDLHRDIIPDLLAAHGLTGCDTVATYFGIGKAAALRVLTYGVHRLTYVGDTIALCPRSLPRPHHSLWHAMDRLNVRR